MPFISRRAALKLDAEMESQLTEISRSRTESRRRVERAQMLLEQHARETVSAIARKMWTNRPKVERCLK